MDKETIELIEAVRQQLVDYGKQVGGSAQKKTKKITSQLIWSPEEHVDELDNILATSKTDEEAVLRVRSLVRKSEEDALKKMTVLPDDTGHHVVQSRTGGDALTDLPYQRSGPIISRLSEKHQRTFGNTMGPQGNLPPEMSLSNWSHKTDDKATGLERESGIGVNPDKSTVAHNKGTAAYANMKNVDMSSDAAIEAALDQKVGEQIQAASTAAQTDAPRQEYLRQASGQPELYRGPVPKEIDLDRNSVLASYNELITPRRARLKMPKGAKKVLPLVGLAGYVITAGQQARAGDLRGAVGSLGQGAAAEVAGHIPVVGDMIEPEGSGDGTLQGGQAYMQRVEEQRQQREQRQIERQTINRRGRQTKRELTGTEAFNNGQ